jgi:hypothetical protein
MHVTVLHHLRLLLIRTSRLKSPQHEHRNDPRQVHLTKETPDAHIKGALGREMQRILNIDDDEYHLSDRYTESVGQN